MNKNLLILICFSLFLIILGCAENRATGKKQFVLLDSSQEEDIGSKEHPNVLKAFGGIYGSSELRDYVTNIGNKIAKVTEEPNLKWKFTVLDSPIVNAFALPGGYVYISRGLLSLANDEAELASVLGHEIAHITARHTAQRHAKATLSEIGLNILDLLVGQPVVSNVASIGTRGILASFSRAEEIEADFLGMKYAVKAGYDQNASQRFLARLGYLSDLSSENNKNLINSIFSTHPRTKERVENIKQNPVDYHSESLTNRKKYLAVINNITYGEGSKNGIIKNNKFLHIPLNIAFSVPKNFEIENRDNAVIARSEYNESVLIFDGFIDESELDLIDIMESNLGRSRVEFIKNELVYNRPAIIIKDKKIVLFENQEFDRKIILIRWFNSRIWRFNILSKITVKVNYSDELLESALDFHQLTDSEIKIAQPKKIIIYETKEGDSLSSLSEMMSLEEKKLEWFKVINGFSLDLKGGYKLDPGVLVKLISG